MSPVGGTGAQADERHRLMEAVTAAALTHLDIGDLLDELVVRVRDLLAADTAAVLLLDDATADLVATAATGIEEEVRQGVRIPVGQGFAGRVAADGAPVVLDHVDHTNVRNPMLPERGIRSLLGVPLVSRDRTIGVMHVGSMSERRFTADDTDLLQQAADRVAVSIEARTTGAERAAAAMLQRSLIPARLPAIPGLELAGRYLPAGEGGVGGDWYDVFSLPSGRIGVVMGDVIGRGLAAAVVMGRLRSALRAYALDEAEPHKVLERLDRKLQHFEAGQMTTVLYAVVDPRLTSFDVSSAGHPLPMMTTADSPAAAIAASVDPPLGVAPGLKRRTTTLDLPVGGVVAVFTDGLVERRTDTVEHGIERLAKALRSDSAERSCSDAVTAMVGDETLHDDVALLVLRRDDVASGPLHLEVPAVPTSLGRIRYALRRWLASHGATEDDTVNVLLAVGEATANAVEHAYGPSGGVVTVDLESKDDVAVAVVSDTGRWRLPRGTNRGRGVGIMESCSEHMSFERTDHGTEVRLHFRIGQALGS